MQITIFSLENFMVDQGAKEKTFENLFWKHQTILENHKSQLMALSIS